MAKVDPHRFTAGTQSMLFRASKCYFPGCMTPAHKQEAGHWVRNLDIAHIRGAEPGSARYDAEMTDDERRAHANLILLCRGHHTMVDKTAPDDYPVATLELWKSENEAELEQLFAISRAEIGELVQQLASLPAAASRSGVDLSLELRAAVLINSTEMFSLPPEDMSVILGANPHVQGLPRLIVVDIRNTGSARAVIQSVDLTLTDRAGLLYPLMGRNDFPAQNPPLPYPVEEGFSVQWFADVSITRSIGNGIPGGLSGMKARVRLATGESFESEARAWPDDV
jgi:hypothetical protein